MQYTAAGSSTNVALKVPFISLIFSEQLAVQLTGKGSLYRCKGQIVSMVKSLTNQNTYKIALNRVTPSKQQLDRQ